jgi:hypothetical protein
MDQRVIMDDHKRLPWRFCRDLRAVIPHVA